MANDDLLDDVATDDTKTADDTKVADDTKTADDTKVADDTKAADDTKSADDKKDVDSKDKDDADKSAAGDLLSDDEDAKQEGVPDQYTFDALKEVREHITDERLNEYTEVAKEAGLTQAQFDALAKFDIERSQEAVQTAVTEWNERVDGWKQASRDDKEIGGEDFDANLKIAKTAMAKFGDKELSALLKSPSEDNPDGLAISNHPAVLRMFHRIGKVLADPELISGDVSNEVTSEDKLKRMYPTMFKESA